jgi:mutator protein MutT
MMGPYVAGLRSRIGCQPILLPGVRAIILNDRQEVLLQRRTDMALWGLPAGSVELGETALEALAREVREETALEARQAEPMALYSGPSQRFTYPNGDEIQCFAVAFIVRDWSGEPRADGEEGSEVRFWAMDALPADLVAIHASTLDDFRKYNGKFVLSNSPVKKERNTK